MTEATSSFQRWSPTTETASLDRLEGATLPRRMGRHRRSMGIGATTILALSIVVVSALAAMFVSLAQVPLYGAQTDLIFDPGPDISDSAATRWLLTQEVVLRSGSVLGPVANAKGMLTKDLEKSSAVEIVGQSNVIRFTVANPDAATAQDLVQLITDEYRKRVEAINAATTPATDPPTVPAADPRTIRWSVLTPPHVLDKPVRPQPVQALALGALAGIFIASGAVAALTRPWIPRNGRAGLDDR